MQLQKNNNLDNKREKPLTVTMTTCVFDVNINYIME